MQAVLHKCVLKENGTTPSKELLLSPGGSIVLVQHPLDGERDWRMDSLSRKGFLIINSSCYFPVQSVLLLQFSLDACLRVKVL